MISVLRAVNVKCRMKGSKDLSKQHRILILHLKYGYKVRETLHIETNPVWQHICPTYLSNSFGHSYIMENLIESRFEQRFPLNKTFIQWDVSVLRSIIYRETFNQNDLCNHKYFVFYHDSGLKFPLGEWLMYRAIYLSKEICH